jgi:iron complex transport system permease protein
LTGLVGISCILALKIGQVTVSWKEVWILLFSSAGRGVTPGLEIIVFDIRLPRIVLGLVVGAALAASGVVFQGLLRNPLADPYLLGLSGGAALGAVLVIVSGAAAWHPWLVPAAAFAGALLAVLVVSRLAAGSGALPPTALILSGVVVSAFCSALVMFLYSISPSSRVHEALFWMMGRLDSPPPGILWLVVVTVAIGILVIAFSGHQLNALSMGEEVAQQLGVSVRSAQFKLFLSASLVTGVSVAASGLVGFVGLVVPHALRSLIGADHRLLVPAAALGGAAVLVMADTGARSLFPPAEIPVGVITALLGAPFFLVLLRRRRGWMG